MRIERPDPDGYPIIYADDGTVLSDPNEEHKRLRAEAPAKSAAKDEWISYAETVGVPVQDADTKDDIIARLADAGLAGGS
ncbi:MAG TPA: hypothetical protein VGR26_15035 [Acidimicrobiales bacterium]|nr:hypothetical protein [Acidimicrobiales bacterium]